MEAWVSTKRVQRFLRLDELDWSKYYHLQCKDGGRQFEDNNSLSATKGNKDINVDAPCGTNGGGGSGGGGGESGGSSVWVRDGCFTWRREGSNASKCDSAQTGKAGETVKAGETSKAGETGLSSQQEEGLEEPTAWMLLDLNLSIRPVSVLVPRVRSYFECQTRECVHLAIFLGYEAILRSSQETWVPFPASHFLYFHFMTKFSLTTWGLCYCTPALCPLV